MTSKHLPWTPHGLSARKSMQKTTTGEALDLKAPRYARAWNPTSRAHPALSGKPAIDKSAQTTYSPQQRTASQSQSRARRTGVRPDFRDTRTDGMKERRLRTRSWRSRNKDVLIARESRDAFHSQRRCERPGNPTPRASSPQTISAIASVLVLGGSQWPKWLGAHETKLCHKTF